MVFDFSDRLDPALISKQERERFSGLSLAVNTLPSERFRKPSGFLLVDWQKPARRW